MTSRWDEPFATNRRPFNVLMDRVIVPEAFRRGLGGFYPGLLFFDSELILDNLEWVFCELDSVTVSEKKLGEQVAGRVAASDQGNMRMTISRCGGTRRKRCTSGS